MDEGITKINRSPLAAAIKASPMPVLPLVGSIKTVFSPTVPSSIRASIMERPIRSFTLASGLKNSSFIKMSDLSPKCSLILFKRTRGVCPIVSVMSL